MGVAEPWITAMIFSFSDGTLAIPKILIRRAIRFRPGFNWPGDSAAVVMLKRTLYSRSGLGWTAASGNGRTFPYPRMIGYCHVGSAVAAQETAKPNESPKAREPRRT